MLPMTVVRSSSDGVATRYVQPNLWMTSCFHTMGPMGQNKARRCLEEVRQVEVPVRRQDNYIIWLN